MTKISNQYSLTNILTADLANSRLGINNVSPTVALDVTGAGRFSSSVTALSLDVISSSGAGTSTATGLARFITAATTIAISVGQFNAARKLDLYSYGISVTGEEFNLGTSTAHPLVFQTNATERMRITSAGNVGIGTTAPQALLTIAGANQALGGAFNTYGNTFITSNNSPAINNGGSISFGGRYFTGNTTLATFGRIHGKKEDATDGSTAGYLVFETVPEATALLTERMRITSAGNVGIGTSSPTNSTLEVRANADSISWGSVATLYGYLTWGTSASFGENVAIIKTPASTGIVFQPAGTERMRITSGGQLLIGMSSAVSFRSDSQLQVNNCTILRSNDGYNGNPSAVIYSGNDQSGTMFVEFTSSGFSRIGSITRNGASNVSYNTGSDIRIKKNIIDAPTSLNKLNSIQVRSFDWVEDDAHQDFGFIAQELINVMPIAVTKGAKEKDIWQVDNSKLVPLLVKSIQELSAEITILKNK